MAKLNMVPDQRISMPSTCDVLRKVLEAARLFLFLIWLVIGLYSSGGDSEGYYSLRGQSHDLRLRIGQHRVAGLFGKHFAILRECLALFFQEFLTTTENGSELQGHHAEQPRKQRHSNEVLKTNFKSLDVWTPTEGLGRRATAF